MGQTISDLRGGKCGPLPTPSQWDRECCQAFVEHASAGNLETWEWPKSHEFATGTEEFIPRAVQVPYHMSSEDVREHLTSENWFGREGGIGKKPLSSTPIHTVKDTYLHSSRKGLGPAGNAVQTLTTYLTGFHDHRVENYHMVVASPIYTGNSDPVPPIADRETERAILRARDKARAKFAAEAARSKPEGQDVPLPLYMLEEADPMSLAEPIKDPEADAPSTLSASLSAQGTPTQEDTQASQEATPSERPREGSSEPSASTSKDPDSGAGAGVAALLKPSKATEAQSGGVASKLKPAKVSSSPRPPSSGAYGNQYNVISLDVVLSDLEAAENQKFGEAFTSMANRIGNIALDSAAMRSFLTENSSIPAADLDSQLLVTAPGLALTLSGFLQLIRENAITETAILAAFMKISPDNDAAPVSVCRREMPELMSSHLGVKFAAERWEALLDASLWDHASETMSIDQWTSSCKTVARMVRVIKHAQI
mmetsp:Transcript_34724/g.63090  ORF Transcript_34724/g.63090 Transcript_34724/m.63090 type:complete len:483 (+) Transcript_34724:87-1535(+)|eukprot:CAMPEP_0197677688 /NCGR_PEP_ID=MMETSP1338-20131121/88825_1 /TAXON_ID=43686 ORGANISM="Pelagodinium beii, Strain RCC1491" /NCGR_SAMPLE_ID=MMETSP1338 /ASSEMBLY_ACC=CAM_ASM_000754 /LENGTH=482 /DNA_ID=CAMNT_0043258539 /DNA_START=63 /DNA_END=1511 /DNA_ORIENTATION=-